MKKNTRDKIIIALFFIMLGWISTRLILAQADDAEIESDSVETEASPSTTQALKDRIEKKAEEDLADTEQENNQADQKKKAVVGQIERVSEEAITLLNSKGTQIVPVDETTQLTKAGKTIELADIAIEESAIVLGFIQEESFQPIKIIITEEKLLPNPQKIVIGSLIEIGDSQLIICSRESQEEIIFNLNTSTRFEDETGEKINRSALFEEVQLLVAGSLTTDTDDESDSADETSTAAVVRSLAALE
jgi:adenosyl cobinamide kinase/adenosyl cobinamide phosphate guanylyltransferase